MYSFKLIIMLGLSNYTLEQQLGPHIVILCDVRNNSGAHCLYLSDHRSSHCNLHRGNISSAFSLKRSEVDVATMLSLSPVVYYFLEYERRC